MLRRVHTGNDPNTLATFVHTFVHIHMNVGQTGLGDVEYVLLDHYTLLL